MDALQTVPLWVLTLALGALGTVITIGILAVREHFKDDAKVRERVAVIESKVDRVEKNADKVPVIESKVETIEKLMDGEHGIIKRLHTHGNNITRLLGRLFKEDIGK